MKRSFRMMLALLFGMVLLAPTAASAHPHTADGPYCGIWWGSLEKRSGLDYGNGQLTNVRTGQHHCFDRLVLDIDGSPGDYAVRYVDSVTAPGSGFDVPLRGGAQLEIIARVPSYDFQTGEPTYDPANPDELRDVSAYRTLRQVASAGSFEGQTTIGLGVRARLPFRVFTLDGPGEGSRLVVDVAHRWK